MANDANDTTTAQDDSDTGVHRLRDILVEEVSLVDRAANKRRFLVVKRSDNMAKQKQPGKDAGNVTTGTKKTKAKVNTAVGRRKAKARRRPAGAEDARSENTGKAADEYDDDDEAEKAGKADDEYDDDEAEKAGKAADEYDDDDEAEKAGKAGDEYDDEAEKADDSDDDDEEAEKADDADDEENDDEAEKADDSDDDDDEAEKADDGDGDGDDDDDDDDGDSDSVVLPAAVKNAVLGAITQAVEQLIAVADRVKGADTPDDDADVYVPESLTDALDDAGELIEGIGARLPTTKSAAHGAARPVTKGGARMAKERLDRFQKALELLSQVLKELTAAKQPGSSARAAATTRKYEATPALTELTTQLASLLGVVKQQQVDLDRIRKAHGTSNALLVERGSRERRAPADVSWPLDMNRPITRDSVAKATSFYDDAE